jgi:hypothetical protein
VPPRLADEASDFAPISHDRVDFADRPPSPPAEAVRYAPEGRPQAKQQRYRFDAGSPRSAMPSAGMRIVSPHGDPQTLASRVFQWHATLAPYAGLAMTFVLAMFAGLLYWAMGGRSATSASGPAAAPQWAVDVDASPSADRNFWSLPSQSRDALASPLSQTPIIQLNIPPLGDTTGESVEGEEIAAAAPAQALETEPAVGAVSEEAAPIEDVGAPASEGAAEEPHLTANHGIAPTAEAPAAPLTISYPTTPFASFDFGPTAHQAAAPGEPAAPAAPR